MKKGCCSKKISRHRRLLKKYQLICKQCLIGIVIINEIVYNRMQKFDGGVI